METPSQLIPGSPPSNHLPVKLAMDESLEQFLEQFFVQYSIDEIAQQLLLDTLAKNMICSVYSLSRASPNALILSGIPAAFVDECTRSGMFISEENDEDKLAVTSSSVQTGPKIQNANRWIATQSTSHGHASLDTPYRRDTPNSQRAENWSVDEMMILLEAKKVEDAISVASRLSKKIRPARETWKAISDRLVEKNVRKTPHQCWIKWVKLNKSFRKIFRYEKIIPSSQESFWNLSTKARKDKSMPTSFHQDVYNGMVEKFGDVKEARRGGHLIELSTPGEERSIGEALQPPPEAHDDLLSITSQHLNFELEQPKRQRTTFPTKGERMQSTKQLIMYYEDMENKKLQIERHRILSDEKRNASLCNSIAEIANAIRSIADAFHPKS